MSEQSHILFNAGGLALAADSTSVHCIHDGLTIQPEDGTVDWFLGLAVVDERLLSITDLGIFLNGNASAGRIFEVARRFGIFGLKIDEVHGVSKKRPVRPDSDRMAAAVRSPLKRLAINDLGQHYQIVDIAGLLQSSRFLYVQHETA